MVSCLPCGYGSFTAWVDLMRLLVSVADDSADEETVAPRAR